MKGPGSIMSEVSEPEPHVRVKRQRDDQVKTSAGQTGSPARRPFSAHMQLLMSLP